MAYNFRPSRSKAATNTKRLVKRESVFQVERGPISEHKRDMKQLDEFRKRSYMQRECNKFKTTSQRSDLTVGEQEMEKYSSKSTESSGLRNTLTLCSIQTLPSVQRNWTAAKFTSGCFEYIQNYHHYVLDLNKLEKGEEVPYLSHMEKQNGFDWSKMTTSGKTQYAESRCSLSVPSNICVSCLPKRAPKSSSSSRTGSVGSTAKTDSNILVNKLFNDRSSIENGARERLKSVQTERLCDNPQDLIISKIEDGLEEYREKESPSDFPDSHVDSIYDVSSASSTDLRVPSGTPNDTPRSSSVHSSFPGLSKSWPRDSKKYATLPVVSEVHKPYLASFTTRIPPLKAPDFSLNQKRRTKKSNFSDSMPDYQRYRILCDAFRPMGERGRRQIERNRPNFVTSEELDYYTNVVNSISAWNGLYNF